jgi:hypothetical protein
VRVLFGVFSGLALVERRVDHFGRFLIPVAILGVAVMAELLDT